jgi:poly-gamma-glutamate system protein
MEEAVKAVSDCRQSRGIGIEPARDVNLTGLIGVESSPLTTSLGNLEAKRTTVNPNFAGLIAFLLREAGVGKGGTVAIGASSSVPGRIVASLCAVRALDLQGLLVCSLGSSEWGANHPGFHCLDILSCLERSGHSAAKPVGLSLGGEGDTGQDMSPEGRALVIRLGRETGLPFVSEPDLQKNVRRRLRIFEQAAGGAPLQAFVNIGGGYANMGTDSEILKVEPGLAVFSGIPPPERRGLIFEMAARRVPVIHLLYVKGLCERYGLPWDPSPLPEPGEGAFYERKEIDPKDFLILAAAYFLLAAVGLAVTARL